MKNRLFILLSAVMCLSACQEAIDNSLDDTVEVTFHASVEPQTKTIFGDKTDGAYPVTWTSGKAVGIYASENEVVKAVPSAGANTTFSATLPNVQSGTLRVVSPAGRYDATDAGKCEGGFTDTAIRERDSYVFCVIPSAQKALAGSCDESAMLCYAQQNIPSSGISSSIDMHFALVNAFVRMTISGVAGNASRVVVTFPAPVAGDRCRYTFDTAEISEATEKSISIDASAVQRDASGKLTVWFGCAPAVMSSGSLDVHVTDVDGKEYSRSIALSSAKRLVLNAGHVRPVDLSVEPMGGTVVEPKVVWSETWTGGSSGETPSAYGFEGTTVYGGAKVKYAQSSTSTKLYNESLAGGAKPELLLAKSGGTWTVSDIPTLGASSLTLTLKSNRDDFTVSSTTAGVSVESSASEWKISNTLGSQDLALVFKTTTSNNVRLDDLSLVTSGAGVAPVTVVNTEDATAIGSSSAVLHASYKNASRIPAYAGFYYWTTSESQARDVYYDSTVLSSTAGSFSTSLQGLAEGVTYQYRAYVRVYEGSEYVEYKSQDVKSFTTSYPQADVLGDQLGWYELPQMNIAKSGQYMVDANDSDKYFAYHWCAGPEKDRYGETARNYTVCFSAAHHCPVWIAAPRHRMYETKATDRTEAYRADDAIPASLQYLSTSTGGGCNKGHMLGSAERTSSAATNRQVFFYSNIAPQLSAGFNTGGGGWNLLEDYIDTQVCSDTLYVVIGCYFDQYKDGYGNSVSPKKIAFGGRSDVSFPTMFYYAVMRTKSGSSGKALVNCSQDEIKCVAFVRSHTNNLKGQKPTSRDLMSISDLEKITGYKYFVNVPNAPKGSFKASDWGL